MEVPRRMPTQQRHTIRYSGRVQGVGFRWTARSLLESRPVSGYVRNLRDGSVELVLEGDAAELERAESLLRAHLASHIHSSTLAVEPATGEFQGFSIVR
jgi:acylphosphatase